MKTVLAINLIVGLAVLAIGSPLGFINLAVVAIIMIVASAIKSAESIAADRELVARCDRSIREMRAAMRK